ncbi:hypothetical protein SAMN05443575_2248 [Jatrophihabitans endophyticus]|uniref:Uncharacterized protein n=1 Tax=Jatrophihabitans endophyticus TaxID=1206085 RepID=A0A1M5KSM9_9ACTN|nr:hypothetical protein [Jatrophihabitans endophyticus]SHG55781.1 hypothetical protein SAMN05443575_2248 [Jatrophihabitans endophyticus]
MSNTSMRASVRRATARVLVAIATSAALVLTMLGTASAASAQPAKGSYGIGTAVSKHRAGYGIGTAVSKHRGKHAHKHKHKHHHRHH